MHTLLITYKNGTIEKWHENADYSHNRVSRTHADMKIKIEEGLKTGEFTCRFL